MRKGAARIGSHAAEAMTGLLPKGSGGAPSEVKPEIWQDWEVFADMAAELGDRAAALAVAAENGLGAGRVGAADDLEGLSADKAFVLIGRSCSACHGRFRVETD